MGQSKGVFVFSGVDHTKKAFASMSNSLKQFKKSLDNVQKTIKKFTKAISTIGNLAKKAATAILKIAKGLANTITSFISKTLNTVKKVLTSAFTMVKTIVTTITKWMVKAVGKLCDTVISSIKTAVKVALVTVAGLLASIGAAVKSYAEKEDLRIQLKVSLGDDYDTVMNQYRSLLKTTTASSEEVLELYKDLSGAGLSGKDLEKYAKAITWISRISGKSFDEIREKLLSGEDLTKDLKKWGVEIQGTYKGIDSIITSLEPKITELANNSLSQQFANIKTDLSFIWEKFGQIFAGPVRSIAKKISEITDELADSDLTDIANTVNEVFAKIWKKLEKVFDFIKLAIKYPQMIRDIKELIVNHIGTIIDDIKDKIRYALEWSWNFMNYIFKNGAPKIGEYIKDSIENATKAISVHFSPTVDESTVSFYAEKDSDGKVVIRDKTSGAVIDSIEENGVVYFTEGVNKYGAYVDKQGKVEIKEINTPAEIVAKWAGEISKIFSASIIATWNNKVIPALGIADAFKLDENNSNWRNFKNAIQGLWESDWFEDFKADTKSWWETTVPKLKETVIWLGETLANVFESMISKSETIGSLLSSLGVLNTTTAGYQAAAKEHILDFAGSTSYEGPVNSLRNLGITADMMTSDWLEEDVPSSILEAYGESPSKHVSWERFLKAYLEIDKPFINAVGAKHVLGGNSNGASRRTTGGGGTNSITGWSLNSNGVWLEDEVRLAAYRNAGYSEIVEVLHSDLKSIETFVDRYNSEYDEETKKALAGPDWFDFPYVDKIPKFATGGIVTSPTVGLIGEAGPEAIIPLAADYANSATSPVASNIANIATGVGEIVESYKQQEKADKAQIATQNSGSKTGQSLVKGVTPITELLKGVETRVRATVDFIKNFSLKDTLASIGSTILDDLDSIGATILNSIGKLPESALGYIKTVAAGLADTGAFGGHLGNIVGGLTSGNIKKVEDVLIVLANEILPYVQSAFENIGGLFDEAFDILGNAFGYVAEEVSQMLIPVLEALTPVLKVIADIVIALTPVFKSLLQPAIDMIIIGLQMLATILDELMPVIAWIGAIFEWCGDVMHNAVAGFVNWLVDTFPRISKKVGLSRQSTIEVKGWKEYQQGIMDGYNASKSNTASTADTTSTSVTSQTASYAGTQTIHVHNDFSGSYVVGNGGFRELALIIQSTLNDLDYSGQTT